LLSLLHGNSDVCVLPMALLQHDTVHCMSGTLEIVVPYSQCTGVFHMPVAGCPPPSLRCYRCSLTQTGGWITTSRTNNRPVD
ncbi:hypothetical protein KUCAC02_009167, partial [Chaenocephalus aceratus]